MNRKLHIAEGLALPLEAVTQTFAVLAQKGSGKTYAAMVLVEEMLGAGLPVVVIDPVGVWWGLRAAADGAGPGLPITILGGDHADLPLAAGAGVAIADLVARERLPLVLDLSRLEDDAAETFVADFARRLYHVNRAALHVVIDEADQFAPQTPSRAQADALRAVDRIARRGRAHGLGLTIVTQRAAVISKSVLSQIAMLFVLRTISPQDRGAIDGWVEANASRAQRDEVMTSLAALEIGEAWVWSPGWLGVFERVKIRTKHTYDSSATPKVGVMPTAPRVLAPVDLERLRGAIAAQTGAAEATDPEVLRARIRDLELQLRDRPAAAPERVEVPVLGPDERAALAALEQALEPVAKLLADALGLLERIGRTTAPAPPLASPPPPVRAPRPAARPRAPVAAAPAVAVLAGELRKGERAMLGVLARYARLTRVQLGTLAGFAPSGGTFGAYVGTLKPDGGRTSTRVRRYEMLRAVRRAWLASEVRDGQ